MLLMNWSPEICLTLGKTLCCAHTCVCLDIRKLPILLWGYILSSVLCPSITAHFCQEQAASVERMTFGMSGLIRSLAPGDTRWERGKEVEVEWRGINKKKTILQCFTVESISFFLLGWTPVFFHSSVLCCWRVSGRFLTTILEVMTVYAMVLNW